MSVLNLCLHQQKTERRRRRQENKFENFWKSRNSESENNACHKNVHTRWEMEDCTILADFSYFIFSVCEQRGETGRQASERNVKSEIVDERENVLLKNFIPPFSFSPSPAGLAVGGGWETFVLFVRTSRDTFCVFSEQCTTRYMLLTVQSRVPPFYISSCLSTNVWKCVEIESIDVLDEPLRRLLRLLIHRDSPSCRVFSLAKNFDRDFL